MTTSINLNALFLVGLALSMIGMGGLLWRKNLLVMLMCLEVMLVGIILGLVGATCSLPAASQEIGQGAMMVFFVLVVAAAEVAIGVSLIVQLYKRYATIWVDDIADDE